MSIFAIRARLQEENPDNSGGGGNTTHWAEATFGADGAAAFKEFNDPAAALAAWTAQGTELATLKANQPTFDWRKEIGGEDETAQKLLGRYTDPKAFFKAHTDAVAKITSGELAKPLPKDATPEQIKTWREANGIPLEVKGYFDKLPDGVVIGKEDQAAFDRYGAIWHQFNIPPAAAHAMTQAYYADLDAVAQAERKLDDEMRLKTTNELRTLWGNDFDANESVTGSWLDGMGGELKQQLMDAVMPDGSRLWNNRAVREFFAKTAREANPLAHLIPGGGEGGMMSLESELAKMTELMADQNSKYWKGPEAEKLQLRTRQINEALAKIAKKK